jgi:glutamate racemase
MSAHLPIGVFDSGIGGLSVLRHIRELLPAEELVYVADRGHIPYGNKQHDYIVSRSILITEFLLELKVKSIVVACNTATAAAVSTLRSRYSIPIIGMEPGVKPAIQHSRNGMIGILATEGTLGSGKFKGLVEQHANGAELFIQPCHGWVEHIESQDVDNPQSLALVQATIAPLIEKNVDTLVLGCTHYPFLEKTIRQAVGDKVTIIDTGYAVASHLRRRLNEEGLLNDNTQAGKEHFWCTGPIEEMQRLVNKFWGSACRVTSLPDQASLS